MKPFRVLNAILVTATLIAAASPVAVRAAPSNATSLPATLQFTLITSGLTNPDFITNAGDGSNRLFIIQQTGQIRIFKNGSLLSTPFLNIAGLVSNFTGMNGEQGLLGLAFDPNYASNGTFYITYTTHNSDPVFLYTTTLARYHVSSGNPDVADTSASSRTVLLSIPKKFTNHNGGMIAFGPDGFLYMSMGDGGSGGDPDNNAQNLDTMLGKLLRLDLHTAPAAGQKYVIPSTNPFFGSSDPNVKKEIWAYGLRNTWRFSFDRATGDVYMGDVGQNIEEEVDFQAAASGGGQNYGWHILEGNLCFSPSTGCVPPAGYVPPVATYDHGTNDSVGCSITGGYVYRGSRFPSLQGVYFYGDFCSGKVWGLVKGQNNTWTSGLITAAGFSISSFGQDEQGELYLADYGNGRIYQLASPTVVISGNVGVAGATLSYVDVISRSVLSLPDGTYSIRVPIGWSGTVTPSLACYTFNPVSRSYGSVTTNQLAQDYANTILSGPACAHISVSIAGGNPAAYGIPAGGIISPTYPGVQNGPVHVTSDLNMFTSQRVHNNRGFVNELMGFPASQLTNEYWFPWYDNLGMQSWILVGNPSTSSSAHVHIFIAGTEMPGSPYTIGPGGSIARQYGVLNGPVHITSDFNVFTSERVATGQGFVQETMGYPNNQLTTDYWFPWYDNLGMTSWILVGNPSASSTAHVHIFIAGVEMSGSPYTIEPGGRITPQFGVMNGPVHITSDIDVFTSERVHGINGFVQETMGYPNNRLTNEYWFPWYDNLGMISWILVGNPSTSSTAHVHIFIAGVEMSGSPYTIGPGGRITPQFGVVNGPVHVTSDINVFTSERVHTGQGFVQETMGYPNNRLINEYWFPWYDNITTMNWVLIGRP